ncbi:ubiquitin carboxyl-terminal hydrolase 23 [Olea europaea subsp. europaea]|uniref:Ubiquitin carboxyl-terminal hydrolase n=1 Tax=Olea europaea subsp. europaea TaxID=158383 RepID=A0A8S0V666_OLEEU|nr:ubiquitin carboxyl-terminal hydrolase 23 [Olea europaea subsp. europaea]
MDSVSLNRVAESEPDPNKDGSAIFHRRIEFHLARKSFNGFSNSNSNGFKLVTLNPGSSNGFSSEPQIASLSGKKVGRSELLENGLDPELSFGITFRRIGAGLRNLGNTCFLNSVLQCLTYTEPLAAYLQSGKHQTSCRTAGFCALCAIQKHVSRALQSTGRILEPKDLVSNLRCISRNFRNARQEDAHEYMVNLLESMHKCCLPSGVPSESPNAYEKSLVHKIFGGCLRSQVKCMQCSYCSDKFDPFIDLSLEIMKADSLYKALAHFTAKEQLDGGARQYQCEQCKEKVKALKQLTIFKAPNVLTIHLKRFGSHVQGQKIDKKIEFGPALDLKPFVTGPYDGDLKYTLYGVLVHAGWSTRSGHYYCFVRTSSGMWYSLDDNQVVQVNERKVLQQKAYMLFYVRDRRNFASKKPDVIQKENVVMNAFGKEAISKSQAHKDSLNTNTLKKTPMKESSSQKVDGSMAIECSPLNRDPLSESILAVPSAKDSVRGLFAVNTSAGNHLAHAVSSAVYNMGSCLRKDSNESIMVPSDCNGPQGSIDKKELSDSVIIPSSCNQDTSGKEDLSNPVNKPSNSSAFALSGNGCNTNDTKSEMCDSKAMSLETPEEASNKISCVKSSKQICIVESQVGGSSGKGCDSVAEEAHHIRQRKISIESEPLSGLPVTTECMSIRKANMKKSRLKVKSTPFKFQVAKMKLSSNIIFGTALCLQKKKCKKRKHLCVHNKKACREHFSDGNNLCSDLGTSSSDQSLPVSFGHSKRKEVDWGSNDKDKKLGVQNFTDNGNIPRGVSNDEFIVKVDRNETMLSTDKQLQNGLQSTLDGKQSTAQGSNCSGDNRTKLTPNGIMSMLTRGLEEITVARWDDIDIPPSRITESRGRETLCIGYIGDEWDEEYDRGKKKKLRSSKLNVDGPNLFQEIATKNAKRQKAKLDRSSSGNQPFRI